MDRWRNKVAVVTGASSGIGKAVAIKLATEGMIVVGLARRKEKLDELSSSLKTQKGEFHGIQTDLTKEEDILNAFAYISKNLGPIHVLINNAGVTCFTSLCGGKTKIWRNVLDTNVIALCIATREAVQNMIAHKVDGHIIHINSISGHSLVHGATSMYGASKFAVTSLTQSLRIELNTMKSKTRITSISPGVVDTDIIDKGAKETYGIYSPEVIKQFKKSNPLLQPNDIADCVIYVLEAPPHVQVHEVIIRPVGEKI